MEAKRFNEIVEHRLASCQDTLTTKNKEYSSDTDRLHNFKIAGKARGIASVTSLDGMLMKHLVSMWDIMDQMEQDRNWVPSKSKVSEKLGDIINYCLLLEALIEDRRKEKKIGYYPETVPTEGM